MNIYQYIICENPDTCMTHESSVLHYCDAGTSYKEAKLIAIAQKACVVELSYVFDDSELIDDYREEVKE